MLIDYQLKWPPLVRECLLVRSWQDKESAPGHLREPWITTANDPLPDGNRMVLWKTLVEDRAKTVLVRYYGWKTSSISFNTVSELNVTYNILFMQQLAQTYIRPATYHAKKALHVPNWPAWSDAIRSGCKHCPDLVLTGFLPSIETGQSRIIAASLAKSVEVRILDLIKWRFIL